MTTLDEARVAILTADVRALMAALEAETRVVGGAVRNALLGVPIEDFDLCTVLEPRDAMARARAAGWKVVPTGIEHGTITLVIHGRPYEVTTLREDVATDGRRAEVRFGTSFAHDAARRDFTINAMSMGPDGVLHDDFGGLEDLRAGRVRFIGDATTRLREDYLRGLRFLRFSATYAHTALDAEGLAAVQAERAGFERLSRERVRQEFFKLLMAPRVVEVMAQAEESGLVSEILRLPIDIGWMQARINAGGADVLARLYALCLRETSDVDLLRESLRLSNAEQRFLERLARAVTQAEGAPASALRAMAAGYPDVAREAVAQLSLGQARGFVEEAKAAIEPLPAFDLTGKDALALGLAHGPAVGTVLAAARALWVARGAINDRAAQLECLKAAMKEA